MLGLYGIMEKNVEATIVYWGYIGIMERKWKLLYVLVLSMTKSILGGGFMKGPKTVCE